MAQPAKYYRANVVAGLEMLDALRRAGGGRIVFSSSAAVYGEPAKQPIEEADPTDPTNPYGETKLAFERALLWFERAYGMRHACLRYFNAAGATRHCGEVHDPETHLIPIVLDVARGRRPDVVVYGSDYPTKDGTCVRDYVHVSDLARAHILALGVLSEKSVTYNLGCGGEGHSVREVIDVAREVTGQAIPIRPGARRPGDPAKLIADSRRIREELGKHYGEGSLLGWFFVAVRTFGSAIVVPPIEEAFYRSFLYRYLVKLDFLGMPMKRMHGLSFVVTALIFGLVHYQWIAGVFAAWLISGW